MTINYCDYAAGNDSTGDGSAGNPYKTITKASTGLSGGDEVRCAKSPAPTALSGTLTFTDGSTSVATSVDLTAVLAAKDFISLNSTGDHSGETWWEVKSLTSTTITLQAKYSGTGGTGTGYKLGVTDTGAAAGSIVQQVSASGSSGHLIKISGGWNLSGTPVQDGYTWFFQSGTNKDGYALQLSYKSYIDLDFGRVGFLRYSCAIDLSSSNNNTITTPTCNGNSYCGIYLSSSNNNTITTPTCNGNSDYGIYLGSSNNNTITSATCNSNSTGIYLYSSSNNTITSPTCNSNSSIGINLSGASSCVCWGYCHNMSEWNTAIKIYNWYGNKQNAVSIGESYNGGAAYNRRTYYGGYTQDNTAEADGGSGKCLQFNPKSATYWIEQDFVVPVAASTARTVSIKMKDDASFNGKVELELWYNGVLIVGPTTKTMTTSYAAQEMTAAAGDITADGVLTLKVKVYGTAGCVYADTLTYS